MGKLIYLSKLNKKLLIQGLFCLYTVSKIRNDCKLTFIHTFQQCRIESSCTTIVFKVLKNNLFTSILKKLLISVYKNQKVLLGKVNYFSILNHNPYIKES